MSATHVLGRTLDSAVIELVEITSIGGGLADNAATNAKLADVPTATLKGRTTAGAGDPEDLTPAQARALLNVEDGATANASDASLRDRSTHTGTQLAATISDFAEAARDTLGVALVAGTNVTITPNDGGDTITIEATAGSPAANSVDNTLISDMADSTIKGRASGAGLGDPTDLTAAQVRTILNVADGATANSSDASLRDRSTHTGTQLAATISDFAEAARDTIGTALVAGSNVTLTVNDAGDTITIDASAAASGNFTPGGTGSVARSQDSKFRELGISVIDYGADPTGVAASDTAFTNAANAAMTYGLRKVYIPAGTYRLNNQWVLDQPLFWQGAGRDHTVIRSYYTAGHGVDIIGDGGTDFIRLESFQIEGMGTHAANLHGVRVAFKSRWYSVYVNGFTNDGIWMDTLSGGASGAVFFMHMNDVWSKNNGRDGIRVRAGANACIFTNCDWSGNGMYGFHHLTDGFATYGNLLLGGQASYNGQYGYYFESGTDLQAHGLYGEQNGCTIPGDNSTDYLNTPYDFYVGDNVSRSFINIGTLFGSSSTHVRAPSRGLNDGCMVMQGGRRIYTSGGTTSTYNIPTEASAVATVSTANASDLSTAIALANQLKTTVNNLLTQLRNGNTIQP